jgi:hypothetical protein
MSTRPILKGSRVARNKTGLGIIAGDVYGDLKKQTNVSVHRTESRNVHAQSIFLPAGFLER